MRWERAVHHVEVAAAECERVRGLPTTVPELDVVQLWAVGDVLGPPTDLDHVTVAVVVDLPPRDVPWWTTPRGGQHWLHMTRLPKNPVVAWWRSTGTPVWNHRIVRPVLVWDAATGPQEEALEALRAGRGAAAGLPGPTAEELAARVRAEAANSLVALRASTRAYEERRWAPGALPEVADTLAAVCAGYVDLLDAGHGSGA